MGGYETCQILLVILNGVFSHIPHHKHGVERKSRITAAVGYFRAEKDDATHGKLREVGCATSYILVAQGIVEGKRKKLMGRIKNERKTDA